MKYVFLLIVLSVFLSACCKEDLNSLITWQNSNNLAKGLANGTAWEGKVKLGIEDSGLLSIRFLMRDADSILVQSISFNNIEPKKATSKLSILQTFTAIPSSIYSTGYADVFDYYDPDTTRTNILEIEQFDLDRGIIKGRLNAFYRFYRGPKAQPWLDTMKITDMTFTYQR